MVAKQPAPESVKATEAAVERASEPAEAAVTDPAPATKPEPFVDKDGRVHSYAEIPYYVDGKRVTRTEYVAWQHSGNKQAALDLLASIPDDDQPTPTADPATTPAT